MKSQFGVLAHQPPLLPSFQLSPMELPVTTSPNPETPKTSYRIKTKNLSYKLCPKYSDLGWSDEPNNTTNRYILRNVNCEAKPGEITTIAGPSGAGKTTLLDILAGVIVPNRVSGHVLVNDRPMDAGRFRRLSGYVTQDETLFPLLTVEETLMYSARLRLRGTHEKAVTRVKELLKELGLEHVANTRIGSQWKRGVSGGEKRRVSIGVDLVHDPGVLLVDEPTSGLDSASALHVVLLLKSLAKNKGKTIVLTVHQPGFRILELFDQVVLLSNGLVLHHGPLHLLEEHLKFAGHLIPKQVNVLEFAIDVIESLNKEVEEDDDVEMIGEATEELLPVVKMSKGEIPRGFKYPNCWFSEVLILSQRFSKNIFRTNQLFASRVIQAIVAGVLLGTIFMDMNNDPKKFKLQTRLGFFAFSLTFLLSSTTEALPIFLEERKILMKETSRGAYRVSSYVISNTLVFLPFLLLVAFLYTGPVYWLVGLRRDIDGFLYFALVGWIVVLMSNTLVLCFSALVPNFIVGTSMITGVMGSFFLFSGYFISKDDIPRFYMFMYHLSLFKYPLECLMINEYGGEKGRGRCLQSVEGVCLLDGNGFLMRQGLEESKRWSNLVVMVGFVFGYRFLCFLILWYRSYRSRS